MTFTEALAALADCAQEAQFSRFGDNGRYGVSKHNSSCPWPTYYGDRSKISNTAEIGSLSFYLCPPVIRVKVQGVTAMKYNIANGGMEWLLHSPVLESRVMEAANIFYERIAAWKQENAKVLGGHTGDFPLRDSNGNRIGSASLSIRKDEAIAADAQIVAELRAPRPPPPDVARVARMLDEGKVVSNRLNAMTPATRWLKAEYAAGRLEQQTDNMMRGVIRYRRLLAGSDATWQRFDDPALPAPAP